MNLQMGLKAMTNKLPQGWVECELKNLCEVISKGTTPKNQTEEPNFAKFLKAENITKDAIIDLTSCKYIDEETHTKILKRSILKKNDILITIAGTLGRCAVVKTEDNLNTNQAVCFVRLLNCGINPNFIKYFILSPFVNRKLTNKAKVTAIPNLTLEIVKNIIIKLPPLNEQKRIVKKIEEEFEKIEEGVEKLKLAQEQIKQYRQSVLKSAFDGKLYKTTEWIVSKLGDICDRALKRQDSKKETEIFKYIDISSIDNHKNIITGYVVCTGANAPSRARQIVKCGDVLFSTVRTYLKNVAFLDLNDTDLIASTGFCVIRGKENLLDGRFIFNMCLYDRFLEPLNKLQRGSSYPAVRDNDVFNQFINLPTIDEQKQIVKEIEKRFEVADEVERVIAENLEKAEQLKQSILKKAFEGRLVPQDPTDEPASLLLEKIKSERK